MQPSTANQITTPADRHFFLAPEFPLQRQYEALRAFFVEEEPSVEVAPRALSVSSAISFATTPTNAPPSSGSRSGDLKPPPPVTAFAL
jgi:hypothetical protein